MGQLDWQMVALFGWLGLAGGSIGVFAGERLFGQFRT